MEKLLILCFLYTTIGLILSHISMRVYIKLIFQENEPTKDQIDMVEKDGQVFKAVLCITLLWPVLWLIQAMINRSFDSLFSDENLVYIVGLLILALTVMLLSY